MIRIIAKATSTCPGGEVTGNVFRTFDIECIELEMFLKSENDYFSVQVVGVERLSSAERSGS